MKKSISFLLLLFVTVITAQEVKHLNLEDAVLGYYKGLYPEQKSMQWIDDTDDFIIVENNSVLVNYNLEKRPAIFTLTDLQNVYPDLKRMPNLGVSSIKEIELFLKDRVHHTVHLEDGGESFNGFLQMISAEGDLEKVRSTWLEVHNAR